MSEKSEDELISSDRLEDAAHMMRLYANPLRFRIIDFLEVSESPQRVTEIVLACEEAQQAIVSQQLRILKDAGMLASRRQGNEVFYRIVKPEWLTALKFVRKLIDAQVEL